MARRTVLRSWTTATLLLLSATAGVLAVAPSGGAAEPAPEPVVTVSRDGFVSPWGRGVVYAEPQKLIRFVLADPTDTQHTVTITREDCTGRFAICEQRFDIPDKSKGVEYRWTKEGEYHFYDRFHPELTGVMIVTYSPPPVQPATTTTTTGPTTTTTAAPTTTTTTAPHTTTTTAPQAIHPLEIPPDPVTTTTVPVAAVTTLPPAPTTTAPPAKKDDKAKDKDKDKAASPDTSTTEPPPSGDAVPPESIFDPAMLTPGATPLPGAAATDPGDGASIDAEAAASLLDSDRSDDDDTRLLLLGAGGIALLLLAGASLAWFNRSAAYDPA